MSSPTNNIRPELLEMHKKLLDFGKKDISDAIQNKILKPNRSYHIFELVVRSMYVKSTTTYETINLLCKKDYWADTFALTKSLIENLIVLTYITASQQDKEKNHRAELFGLWPIISIHTTKTASSHFRGIPKIDLEEMLTVKKIDYDAAIKLHKEECGKLKKSYHRVDDNSWSGLSLSAMARETKLSNIYVLYWYCNLFAHPNMEGLKNSVSIENDFDWILPKNKNDINDDLVFSFIAYSCLIEKIDEIFNLNLANEIEIIKRDFVNVNQGT